MTVGQLLATISSRELSEWMIMDDLEHWTSEIQAKDRQTHSQALMHMIAGSAIAKGNVIWQQKTKTS